MDYSNIHITHIHITEDISVAAQSLIRAVNCLDDRVDFAGMDWDAALWGSECVGCNYFEVYWSSYSTS